MVEKMDERKKKILRAVTDDYISSGEPVGSRTIARKYKLGLSPATIRNEMADLEESGFLEQPHTSSGRIPSDRGYRYYVDALMEQRSLTQQEIEMIRNDYEFQKQEFDQLLKQTAKMLTQITKYPSFSTTPEFSQSKFRHVQLVPISGESILVLLVTDTGLVEHKLLSVSETIESEVLEKLSNALNQYLRGKSISEITPDSLKSIRTDLILHEHFFDQVIKLLLKTLGNKLPERIFFDGASHILEQPEFKDVEKVRPLLQLFEEEDKLYSILSGEENKEKIRICIGKENVSSQYLSDCSIVTAIYDLGDHTYGKIGLLGPKRMDYAKVVAIVDYISQYLSNLLKQI